MNRIATAAIVLGVISISSSSVFGQQPLRPLFPSERRAYHACLKAAWVDHYCRWHSYGYLSDPVLSYHTCVVANGVRRVSVPGYGVLTRDSCWQLAQTGRR